MVVTNQFKPNVGYQQLILLVLCEFRRLLSGNCDKKWQPTTSIICIKVRPKLSCSGSLSFTTGRSSTLYASSRVCKRRFSWDPARQPKRNVGIPLVQEDPKYSFSNPSSSLFLVYVSLMAIIIFTILRKLLKPLNRCFKGLLLNWATKKRISMRNFSNLMMLALVSCFLGQAFSFLKLH